MGYIETLIFLRINYFLNKLSDYLSHLLVSSPFDVVDVDLSTWTHQFYHRFYFTNEWSLLKSTLLQSIDWKSQDIIMRC